MNYGLLLADLIYINSFLLGALIIILLCCSVIAGIWFFVKKLINGISNYLNRHYPEPAQQLNKYVKLHFFILFFEMAGILVYLSFNISQPIMMPLLNFTYTYSLQKSIFPSFGPINLAPISTNITGPILNGGTVSSSDNITAIIGIISVFIIFLYFFSVFGKTKYFAEGSEIQKKYASIFFTPGYSVLWCGIIALMIDGALKNFGNFWPDLFLFLFALFNLCVALPIPYIFRNNFYNEGIDKKTDKLDKYVYNYEFIEKFRHLPHTSFPQFTSDSILMFSIIVAIFAFISNSNILMLIFAEYCLLMVHFWSSQLDLMPLRKVTIEFKDQVTSKFGKTIEHVFILDDSQEYLLVVQEDNSVREIMRDTVSQIIYQID